MDYDIVSNEEEDSKILDCLFATGLAVLILEGVALAEKESDVLIHGGSGSRKAEKFTTQRLYQQKGLKKDKCIDSLRSLSGQCNRPA